MAETTLHVLTPGADTAMGRPFTRGEGMFSEFLRAIRARRTLVLVVTLAGVLLSVLWVALRSPEYEATAELLMSPLPQEDQTFLGLKLLRDSGDPTRTAQTAAALIRSQEAAERTARALGAGWTAQRVLKNVKVTPQAQSNLLDLTAKAPERGDAKRLANTFVKNSLAIRRRELQRQATAELERLRERLPDVDPTTEAGANFVESVNRVESVSRGQDPTLSLSEPAALPKSPGGLPSPLILALGILGGFALASGLAMLLELVNRRVRHEDELLAIYPLPVLARVPTLRRRELRERPGPWTLPPAVREAFRTLLVQLREQGEGGGAVMLTSASSGDGKTTSSVNLAVSIAAAGHDCVLLDLDLRKPDVGHLLHVGGGTELAALLQPETRLADLLAPVPGTPLLSVLSTTATETDVILVDAINRRMPDLIAQARTLATYVVIDTAPLGEVSDALRVVGEVDEVVVVARPGSTARAGFEIMRDLLERVGQPPAGMLLIGAADALSPSYYGYGAARRDLYSKPRRSPLARARSR